MVSSIFGVSALLVFIAAYGLVVLEETLHLRKSKPVILAAGLIWALVSLAYLAAGREAEIHDLIAHNLLEYAELLLFLLAAMTYINTLEERGLFDALRGALVSRGFSYKKIFWITGLLAFFISPIADNLTTALLMGAVVIAVAGGREFAMREEAAKGFVALSCINVVVAANAGGAFSPFGDITTLMVWQAGVVKFHEFFELFLPALVNWLVPALILSFFISNAAPEALGGSIRVRRGGFFILALFLITIALAVLFYNLLHLPPVMGMMTGLGLLKFYAYYLKITGEKAIIAGEERAIETEKDWDIFTQLQRAEWDTLLFFYGVILCVGGLGALGYLELVSGYFYGDLGPTTANVLVGLASAVVDNIPVMYAVLTMHPEMSHNEWLLVTLTAGVGGSLLSVGSAAGVGLMGQARGIYTFFSHLKWTWAVALGYAASIALHAWINPL